MERLKLLATVLSAVKKAESRFNLYLERKSDDAQHTYACEYVMEAITAAYALRDTWLNTALSNTLSALVKGENENVSKNLSDALHRVSDLVSEELDI